jgi:hypothetical protein
VHGAAAGLQSERRAGGLIDAPVAGATMMIAANAVTPIGSPCGSVAVRRC